MASGKALKPQMSRRGDMGPTIGCGGPAVLFANSLGTDLRLWDAVVPLLPGIRAIRFDKRGHGLSDRGPQEGIAGLAADAAALIEAVAGGPVVFVGLSIGGMIGQALAHALQKPAVVLLDIHAKIHG